MSLPEHEVAAAQKMAEAWVAKRVTESAPSHVLEPLGSEDDQVAEEDEELPPPREPTPDMA